jgi:filamentous hemagglutinin
LVGDLAPLATTLSTGGFNSQIDVRVRSGNLDSVAGSTLLANQITLTADTGVIDIAGTLSAPSAGLRGSIGLFAGNGLVLESGAVLEANGSASNERGGEIELSTTNGTIALEGGTISASGADQMGSLLLRAPALVSSGDVAISSIGSSVSGVGQVIVEPVLPTYQNIGDFTQNFGQIQSDVTNYLSLASSVIPNRLQFPAGMPLVLEPGVVVETQGNLTLSQNLDLQAQQLGSPIDLTVLATGNITIGGMISDGISGITLPPLSTSSFLPPQSSSLRFVAGADLNSANPLAVVEGSGANLTLEPGTLVRTGTGDIDLVASNDVVFGAGASAYTIGVAGAAPSSLNAGGASLKLAFPTDSGNIVVDAGEDVAYQAQPDQAQPPSVPAVSVSSWQVRAGAKGGLGKWGVDIDSFDQNPWSLATFGGGDLRITAGTDVVNITAATADSMSVLASNSTQTLFAGGGLVVDSGRNIVTGQFYVADGVGTLNAGGSFSNNLSYSAGPVGSLFALQNSKISLWAEGDITIGAVVNPTTLLQPLAPLGTGVVAFYTYGPNSALDAQSTAGNVTLQTAGTGGGNSGIALLVSLPVSNGGGFGLYPASLGLNSLTQDINLLGGGGALYPSSIGQLQLFAGQDIIAGTGANSGTQLLMSDAATANVPTPTQIGAGGGGSAGLSSVQNEPFVGDIHVGDGTPASIVAGRDIVDLDLSIPKAADIEAGRDITNLLYYGQNLNSNDLTLIYAGRDFIDSVIANGSFVTPNQVVQVGGPGDLDLLAGRNINLGLSSGVVTVGNQLNSNLSTSTGANITMVAGLAGLGTNPDYTPFYQQIIAPSATYQQQLVSYVESLNGQSNLSVSQADADFMALSPTQQLPLIDNVFFNELNLSGLAANATPSLGYTRGYAAIDALFPGSRAASGPSDPYAGDLDLFFSQIYTISGGNISLLVPGGAVNVGLANPPPGLQPKPPSNLGIVAQGAGNVDIYSLGSVNVDTSRIFTLGGGNILIWSDEGSIDAGNGAKSSLSAPPPVISVNSQGQVVEVFSAAVAGSGIRTIQTGPLVAAGNVDLIAPVGSVNAGDAGIGAAGNINIAALTVTGVANISFGGTATGVPALVSNLTASLSGAASSASSATTSATASIDAANSGQAAAAPLADSAISWLDVFVTGLGEENCKPDDIDCLKRQKHD